LADRYVIERQLGRGGMATVFLAHDLKHDRDVAIKVLDPELSAAISSERFHREIHIQARLRHPHVVTFIDSGDAEGLLYYVMTYVEGESLLARAFAQRHCPRGRVDGAAIVTPTLLLRRSSSITSRQIPPSCPTRSRRPTIRNPQLR